MADETKQERRVSKRGRRIWDVEMEGRVDMLAATINTHLVECVEARNEIKAHLSRQDDDLKEIRGLKVLVKFAIGSAATITAILELLRFLHTS